MSVQFSRLMSTQIERARPVERVRDDDARALAGPRGRGERDALLSGEHQTAPTPTAQDDALDRPGVPPRRSRDAARKARIAMQRAPPRAAARAPQSPSARPARESAGASSRRRIVALIAVVVAVAQQRQRSRLAGIGVQRPRGAVTRPGTARRRAPPQAPSAIARANGRMRRLARLAARPRRLRSGSYQISLMKRSMALDAELDHDIDQQVEKALDVRAGRARVRPGFA